MSIFDLKYLVQPGAVEKRERRAAEAAQDERDASGKSKLTLDKQQTEQEQGNIFGLIDKYITDPDQNRIAKEEYVRRQAGAKNSFKNLPGASGQPYQTPTGSWVKPAKITCSKLSS